MHDMEILLRIVCGVNDAFMFMPPDYQIDEVRQKVFGKISSICIGMAKILLAESTMLV